MKKTLILISLLFFPIILMAQHYRDVSDIRNFRYNLSLYQYNGKDQISVIFNDYGSITQQSNSQDSFHRYLYHAQEYEPFLGLSFFPSRIYSTFDKRFYQPDPQSQYQSIYSFVGADPINFIDFDGNQGKPIFFYGEEPSPGYSGIQKPWEVRAAEAAGVDAYYLPAGKLFDDTPLPDLSEWNGNVFLHGHSNPSGKVIFQSKPSDATDFDFHFAGDIDGETVMLKQGGGFTHLVAEPEFTADCLMSMSVEARVPLKNVTLDGCQSSTAARRIAERFRENMEDYAESEFDKEIPEKITTMGLKTGRYSDWSDPLSEQHTTAQRPVTDRIRIYASESDYQIYRGVNEAGEHTSERIMRNAADEVQRGIEGTSEVVDYTNGRVGEHMEPFYDFESVPY